MTNIVAIGWDNHLDLSSTLLFPSTADANWPGANIKNQHIAKLWKSTTLGPTSAFFEIDLGSAKTIGLFAGIGSNAISFQVKAGATQGSSSAYDSGVITAQGGYNIVVPNEVSARWWRIDITPPSGVAANLGRVFLGPKWQPAYGISWDWSFGDQALTVTRQTPGGQKRHRILPGMRMRDVVMEFLTEAEYWAATNSINAMMEAVGAHGDVLLIPYNGSSYAMRQAVWGTLQAFPEGRNPGVNRFSIQLKAEERK